MTTSELSIRRAVPDDARAIAEVHCAAWRTAYRGIVPEAYLAGLSIDGGCGKWQDLLDRPSAGAFHLVAIVEESLVGFASGGPQRRADFPYQGEIYAIYLLEAYRRRGIGGALWREAVRMLLEQGLDSMNVWVLRDNRFRAFYERAGGVVIGSEPVVIGGAELEQVAYGWPRLLPIAAERSESDSAAEASQFPRPADG